MKKTKIVIAKRVIAPTITFFDENGKIDEKANMLLIRHVIENRADSLFLMGSTGEGRYFNDKPEEKKKYLLLSKSTISKYQTRSLPILIGTYGEKADDAIFDSKNCLKLIPDAALVIPPPTKTKLDSAQQLQFYDSIFKAIPNPIYLYNNPETFGGTEIALDVVQNLRKYPHFLGIKDSSSSDDQKKIYLKTLTENFTVSCGKEGILAQFLTFVAKDQRIWVGIIPSISNIVNTCAQIFDLGIKGKDTDMLALQKEMNEFREKIYDSAQSKGKAQRGTKIAFADLYKDQLPSIPTVVNPSLKRNIESSTIEAIKAKTAELVKKGHITLVKDGYK